MKTILAAVDLSDVSNRVVEEAAKLAKNIGGRVRLYHVETPQVGMLDYDSDSEEEKERSSRRPGSKRFELAVLEKKLVSEGIQADTGLVRGCPVWRTIREAKRLAADFIIIGSHGHGTIYRFLAGSIGERIRRLAPCPVVTVRAEGVFTDERSIKRPDTKVIPGVQAAKYLN